MSERENTKEILESILSDLYKKQSERIASFGESYLIAQNDQYLGRITTNQFDRESILNQYGPYGSPYSATSIFNKYSEYGSAYGQYSLHNIYTSTPPKLYLRGRLAGVVSANQRLEGRIATEVFLYALSNHLPQLVEGKIIGSESQARNLAGESYVEGHDGQYLGALTLNKFRRESVFNQFGPYGSPYSPTSIHNKYGTYGNQFSPMSPYNAFSTTPPRLVVRGTREAYLTKNQMLSPRVDPDQLEQWCTQRSLFS